MSGQVPATSSSAAPTRRYFKHAAPLGAETLLLPLIPPIEADWVNIYEEWESADALSAFRGEGPDEDLSDSTLRANVTEHVVPTPHNR